MTHTVKTRAAVALTPIAPPLLAWFDHHGRHDLPWQKDIHPYRVWISEIMLQQTQVATVVPYFLRFMARFDDVYSLAAADEDEVLHYWTGLGYYSRARNLHRAAQQICSEYDGNFPASVAELCELPGIGPSTAGAIASIAMGIRAPILDGNVKRVLARLGRLAGWPGQSAVLRQLWELADYYTPRERIRDYTQAIMDLGATVCTPRNPACGDCPLSEGCAARAAGDPEAYPGKKPRKTLPVRTSRFLVIRSEDGRVLLERRDASGVWHGLYCFPELGDESDPQQWCRQRGLDAGTIHRAPVFRHTFSHYHLDIEPMHIDIATPPHGVMAGDRQLWYNIRQPAAVGLAAPVKKLLSSLSAAALFEPETQ